MNHLIIESKKDLEEYIEEFKFTLECPKLFLSNYFIKIRSEVDLQAEQLLAINNQYSDICRHINSNRTLIIDDLNSHEQQCLKNLKQKLNDQLLNEMNQSIETIQTDLSDAAKEIKDLVKTIFEKYSKLTRYLFLNKSVIFSKKLCNEYCRNDISWFGTLIVLDEYLDEHLIEYHFDNYKKIDFELTNETLKINYIIEEVMKSTDPKRYVKRIDFKNLYNVDTMELFYKKIITIDENAFKGLENLKSLELNRNQIKEIKPNSFRTLNRLENLKFEKVNPQLFDSLSSETFVGLTNLASLQLSDTDFSAGRISVYFKQKNIFSSLKSLKFLHLSNNNIAEIEDNFFNGLDNLKDLFLSGNRIKTLEPMSLSGLHSLEVLYLNFNQLDSINFVFHSKLFNLKELFLEGNQLKTLTKGNITNKLENLVEFNCLLNEIKTIDSDYFTFMPNLRIMNLDGNKIEQIDDIFTSLKNLTNLEMSGNLISELKSASFHGLNNLEYVNLTSNRIFKIEKNVFENLTNIYEIDLRNNRLDKTEKLEFGIDSNSIII